MPPKAGLATVLLLAAIATGGPQRSGNTTLALQVGPEARIDPQQVALNFRISSDGASDVTTQTTSIAASVRAMAGQQIRITARLASLDGPSGPAPATAVSWSGSLTRATGGGQAASCSSGAFQSNAAADFVLGWQRSGIVTCAVKFELAKQNLAPGLYAGSVTLGVGAF